MDQHPSPIAQLSRELGDSGTKEILPPTERNLTMLSEGNRKLALSMKTGFTTANGYGWWSFHDITLNRLLDAARAEGATSLEAELKRRDEALQGAQAVIDGARDDLHHERVADWFPEGVHEAATRMSESMRLIGNWLADVDLLSALQQNGPDNAV